MSKSVFDSNSELFARVSFSQLNPDGMFKDVMNGFLSITSVGKNHAEFVSTVDKLIGAIYSEGTYVHLLNNPVLLDDPFAKVSFYTDTIVSCRMVRENFITTYEIWDRDRMALFLEGA